MKSIGDLAFLAGAQLGVEQLAELKARALEFALAAGGLLGQTVGLGGGAQRVAPGGAVGAGQRAPTAVAAAVRCA